MSEPVRIELNDFRFRDDFLDLTDAQLGKAIQVVNAQFSGVYTMWALLPPGEAHMKRELCVNYLIAWKLCEMYPDQCSSGGSTGAIPLQSKKVGPIFIKYKDTVRQSGAGVLDMLTTNNYGLEALALIQTAPDCYTVYR